MASIRTLSPNSYEVHYNVTMDGVKKQRTKNFPVQEQAEAFRKAMSSKEESEREEKKLLRTLGVFEIAQPPAQAPAGWQTGSVIAASSPNDLIKTELRALNIPLSKFLETYVERYGRIRWVPGTYKDKIGYINNYILPVMGDQLLPTFTPLRCQELIFKLQKTKQVQCKTNNLTPRTIEEIYKLLKNAFNKAKIWQIIDDENPWNGLELQEYEPEEKPVWTREQFSAFNKAMLADAEEHPDQELDIITFLVCLHLDMCCHCRIGEATGLEWKNTFVSETSIQDETARVKICQQLSRESLEGIEKTNGKGIIKQFPRKLFQAGPQRTVMVLKDLKTRSSKREVFVPETTARLLLRLQNLQARQKQLLGPNYQNNDLVICLPDGTPCDSRVIQRRIDAACAKLGFERVTTHAYRKTGTNTTLEVTHGDIKTAQQKNGHATPLMTTKTYATMQVERQQKAARLLDDAVFKGKEPQKEQQVSIDPGLIAATMMLMQEHPELLKKYADQYAEGF